MLKGPTTNLAFLTGVLDSDGEGDRDLTQEGRRRAAENGVRKYRGESTRLLSLSAVLSVDRQMVFADSQYVVTGSSAAAVRIYSQYSGQERGRLRSWGRSSQL